MRYLKLLAINISDFYSVIAFEKNYSLDELEFAQKDKDYFESLGHICNLVTVNANITSQF